jgi:GT2 family glycosyltransferase
MTQTLAVAIVHFDTPLSVFEGVIQHLKHAAEVANVRVQVGIAANNDQHFEALQQVTQPFNSPAFSVKLFHGHGNVGFGRANNLVFAGLFSEVAEPNPYCAVLALNPDAYLAPDALAAGLHHLHANAECVLVAGRGIDAQGNDMYICRRYPTLWVLALRGLAPAWLRQRFSGPRSLLAQYERRGEADPPLSQVQLDVDQASGAAMLMRPQAWQSTQFDERYFLHFEDIDLSRRLKKIGRVDYVPQFFIRHLGGNTGRRGFTMLRYFARSAIRYFNDYGWRLW